MADILDFRPSEGRANRRSAGSRSAGCEIVIFPGVRYEHWERKAEAAAQDKPARSARKRVKRDMLEIAD